ncbi:hypothetical protein QBC34DRAFT_398962 [Podospora aff. communis PSN243]|uniref:Ubiquitin-like domain-containing protein n=1 Tax=Podospora aff. communis PSN243 TaxID=3040156 RepID=A0AAV9GXW0_9PEZI|nr:hypothetical protein QBC34DRAFT_398962 [Podospora aff. communis PSN243]
MTSFHGEGSLSTKLNGCSKTRLMPVSRFSPPWPSSHSRLNHFSSHFRKSQEVATDQAQISVDLLDERGVALLPQCTASPTPHLGYHFGYHDPGGCERRSEELPDSSVIKLSLEESTRALDGTPVPPVKAIEAASRSRQYQLLEPAQGAGEIEPRKEEYLSATILGLSTPTTELDDSLNVAEESQEIETRIDNDLSMVTQQTQREIRDELQAISHKVVRLAKKTLVSQVPEESRADNPGPIRENSQPPTAQEMILAQNRPTDGFVTIEEGSLTRKKYEIPYELCSTWEGLCSVLTDKILGPLPQYEYSPVEWDDYEDYCGALKAGDVLVTSCPEGSTMIPSLWESLIKPGRWVKVLVDVPSPEERRARERGSE